MGNYTCEDCKYDTDRLANLQRHNKSVKHLKILMKHQDLLKDNNNKPKVTNKKPEEVKKLLRINLLCKFCGNKFSCVQSLSRHEKHRCTQRKEIVVVIDSDDNEKDMKIKKLEEHIFKMDEKLEKILNLATKNAEISAINAETANVSVKSTKKSMSMMSHAMKHFSNAPPMKQLEGKEAMKLLTYDNKSKHSIEDLIIFNFSVNLLHEYLGNMLIREYKMKNPEDQSMWVTDPSRLCFIVKQIIEGTGDDMWMNDRSGITITRMIIAPLLKIVDELIVEYIKKIQIDAKKNDIDIDIEIMENGTDKREEIIQKMYNARMVRFIISKHELEKDILKYISPYFGFELKQKINK